MDMGFLLKSRRGGCLGAVQDVSGRSKRCIYRVLPLDPTPWRMLAEALGSGGMVGRLGLEQIYKHLNRLDFRPKPRRIAPQSIPQVKKRIAWSESIKADCRRAVSERNPLHNNSDIRVITFCRHHECRSLRANRWRSPHCCRATDGRVEAPY